MRLSSSTPLLSIRGPVELWVAQDGSYLLAFFPPGQDGLRYAHQYDRRDGAYVLTATGTYRLDDSGNWVRQSLESA